MFKKKAEKMAFQFLVVFMITLVAGTLFILYIKGIEKASSGITDFSICKDSNFANAKLKIKNSLINEGLGNKCTTEYVTAPKGKEIPFIANKMAGCWEMYLEGKEDLFETSDNTYCAFCSVITVKDKKTLHGLTDYLLKESYPPKRMKYYDYLTRTSVTNDEMRSYENSDIKKLDALETSSPLAVIFVMGKNAYPGSPIEMSKTTFYGGGGTLAFLGGMSIAGGIAACATFIGCPAGLAFIKIGLVTAGAGLGVTGTGYLIGSNYNPDRETKVLLLPYTKESLNSLKCTRLEGQDRLIVLVNDK